MKEFLKKIAKKYFPEEVSQVIEFPKKPYNTKEEALKEALEKSKYYSGKIDIIFADSLFYIRKRSDFQAYGEIKAKVKQIVFEVERGFITYDYYEKAQEKKEEIINNIRWTSFYSLLFFIPILFGLFFSFKALKNYQGLIEKKDTSISLVFVENNRLKDTLISYDYNKVIDFTEETKFSDRKKLTLLNPVTKKVKELKLTKKSTDDFYRIQKRIDEKGNFIFPDKIVFGFLLSVIFLAILIFLSSFSFRNHYQDLKELKTVYNG